MAGKREFLRDHRFTLWEYVVCNVVTALITLPMFYALLWIMAAFIGVGAPMDATIVLIVLTFLLSACAGMSAGLSVVRWMVRRRSRRQG